MSYILKIGKGKGNSYSLPIGENVARVSDKDKNMTISQLAKSLSKQLEIKNGELEITGIEFSYMKGK